VMRIRSTAPVAMAGILADREPWRGCRFRRVTGVV
jgi:hypothetical protein